MSTHNPYTFVDGLIPSLVARLQPSMATLGVRVIHVANRRAEAGYDAGDKLTIVPMAFSPIVGKGSTTSGLVTLTATLNFRAQTLQQNTLWAVGDALFNALGGWEASPGLIFQYGGSEWVNPPDNDPNWYSDFRYALVYQARPKR